MAKDPAILFYTSDFLTGCSNLTLEERGQYITLLCLQHQTGRLSEKTIRLSVGNVSVDVLSKFNKDENGFYYNERMEIEIQKRSEFTESRRKNGSLGGRPKKEEEKPSAKPLGLASENLTEDIDINVNKDKFDLSFVDTVYLSLIRDFIKYRSLIKKPYKTVRGVNTFYNELIKLSGNNLQKATKLVEQAKNKEWLTVYEIKENETHIRNNEKGFDIKQAGSGNGAGKITPISFGSKKD